MRLQIVLVCIQIIEMQSSRESLPSLKTCLERVLKTLPISYKLTQINISIQNPSKRLTTPLHPVPTLLPLQNLHHLFTFKPSLLGRPHNIF